MDWENDVQDSRNVQSVQNERDDWVPDAQRWVTQIPGVLQCKIDLDPAGEVTGVHVVANMDREPRLIVRDVESLFKARVGMDVYYKKIGVVQVVSTEVAGDPGTEGGVTFHPPGSDAAEPVPESAPAAPLAEPAPVRDSPAPGEPAPATEPDPPIPAILVAEGLTPRILCCGLGVIASDLSVRAEVVLKAGDSDSRGVCEGANNAGSDVRLLAQATIEAVLGLLAERLVLGVTEVRIRNLGGERVVMAAIDLVEGRRSETLFGACRTGHNQAQAVVHAVLDALNRRLSMYGLKEDA